MTSEKKKIVAVTILFFGVAVSIFILSAPRAEKKTETGLRVEIPKNIQNPQFAFKQNGAPQTSGAPLRGAEGNAGGQGGTNLTEELVGAYAKMVARQNPKGFKTVNGKKQLSVPTSDAAQQLFNRQLGQKIPFIEFTLNDLAISENNSKESQVQYAIDLITITQKNFSAVRLPLMDMIEEVTARENTKPLAQYVSAMPNEINDVLALRAPSALRQFHLQNLNLWQRKYAVYSAFLDYANDPLKAMVAMNEIEQLIEETQNLKQVLATHLEELPS